MFLFLVVKFSIYSNRRVFVMSPMLIFVYVFHGLQASFLFDYIYAQMILPDVFFDSNIGVVST